MKALKTATLPLAMLLGLFAGPAFSQDSGTGIDLSFGNKLDPSGGAPTDCDARGMSWMHADHKRSPTGVMYICAPEILYSQVGDWQRSGHLSLGWLSTGGDVQAANWLRFSDWDDGFALGFLGLEFLRPYDGTYVELRASRISSDNQYLKATVGRAGKYKLEAFARSQPNIMSTNAHSIWNGVGSNRLTLVDGLTPAASTVAQVTAASAGAPPMRLQVTRDKQGFALNYFFASRWTGYFSASNEQRSGARAFGGAFFFNFPFPANGGAHEVPRPINDSTINVNGGTRYVGRIWRMDLAYSGSFYRDRLDSFTYENPYPLWAVVPGSASMSPVLGEFATEPDNDYHNIKASLTRKVAMNGELSFDMAAGTMRQNEALLPPANCNGNFGIDLSPTGAPVNPFLFDCSDWNTTASLSRKNADMRIDTNDANVNLVMFPNPRATVRAAAKFRREDYRNVYLAFNPLTGQYGYIAENGAQGAVVPGEMGIWDAGPNSAVLTRIRSLPLDKETHEISFGTDFRLDPKNTLGATYVFSEVERTHREREKTRDQRLKLTWANRSLEWMTFRANYQFLKQTGSDYDYDPYEFTYSTSLPGFSGDHALLPPHTVDALRKYDVASRDQHKLTLITSFMPMPDMTINATVRGDWNDYDAEIGRQNYDTYGFTLSWDWQPSLQTAVSAYLGLDKSSIRIANVNELAVGPNDPTLGGAVYTEAGRWWVDDNNRNRSAGATFAHDFGRVKFDAHWNFTHTRGLSEYRYASAAALAWPSLAEPSLAGSYPQLTYRTNTLGASVTIPIKDRWSLRLFDTWERGQISDWHYAGLENGLVIDHRTYLDSGQVGYSANLVGLLLEVAL